MDHPTLSKITALEESLWRAETRFDDTLMDRTFAPDFVEFGRSGKIYTRAEMFFGQMEGATLNATLPLRAFKARFIAQDVIQTTYVSEVIYEGHLERGNRASLWSRKGNSWHLRFHQGTPVAVSDPI